MVKFSNKLIALLFYFAALIHTTSSQCKKLNIAVRQDGKGLGDGNAVDTDFIVKDLYQYDKGFARSWNGDTPPLQLFFYRSYIFLHQFTKNCTISLVIVHSDVNNGFADNYATMEFDFSGSTPVSLSKATVKDDKDDKYGNTRVEWNWPYCCTDGLAEEMGKDWVGTIEAKFIMPECKGLDEWFFVKNKGGDLIKLDINKPLKLLVTLGTDDVTPKVDKVACGDNDPNPCRRWMILCSALRNFVCWVRQ